MRPVRRNRSRTSGGAEKVTQWLLDASRKLMFLSGLAVLVLVGYLVYGFTGGGLGQWESLTHDARVRIIGNIQGAISYLNISLAVLLLTSSILYWAEEGLGYALVLLAAGLYYGVPLGVEMGAPGLVTNWLTGRNTAALAVYNEARIAGLVFAIPGIILVIIDLVNRVRYGSSRKKTQRSAMQFGAEVEEEEPIRPPLIGAMAKCYQLPFCREFVRSHCPVFHLQKRCWRVRVGCMCEEQVIRTAMVGMAHEAARARSMVPDDNEPVDMAKRYNLDDPLGASKPESPFKPLVAAPPPKVVGAEVKIPRNNSVSPAQKRERCRNCIIYNEHQRLKYQVVSPLVVLAIPALAVSQFSTMKSAMEVALRSADTVMSRLSLEQTARGIDIGQLASSNEIANIVLLGSLILMVLTWALHFTEHCIFQWKI